MENKAGLFVFPMRAKKKSSLFAAFDFLMCNCKGKRIIGCSIRFPYSAIRFCVMQPMILGSGLVIHVRHLRAGQGKEGHIMMNKTSFYLQNVPTAALLFQCRKGLGL
jgi:hypothetical protein